MKTETRKVYFCGHCKKHNLSASSISRHEKYCRYNPDNRHQCFRLCKHLKWRRFALGYRHAESEFRCEKTGLKLYSYQLEKIKSLYPFRIKLDGLTRMPLSCDLYQEMTFEEQEIRFGNHDEY